MLSKTSLSKRPNKTVDYLTAPVDWHVSSLYCNLRMLSVCSTTSCLVQFQVTILPCYGLCVATTQGIDQLSLYSTHTVLSDNEQNLNILRNIRVRL